jgi:hypothetical protein
MSILLISLPHNYIIYSILLLINMVFVICTDNNYILQQIPYYFNQCRLLDNTGYRQHGIGFKHILYSCYILQSKSCNIGKIRSLKKHVKRKITKYFLKWFANCPFDHYTRYQATNMIHTYYHWCRYETLYWRRLDKFWKAYCCWYIVLDIDRGFELRLDEANNYKSGICCDCAEHTALRDNVSEWSEMFTPGLLFQWASTIKI